MRVFKTPKASSQWFRSRPIPVIISDSDLVERENSNQYASGHRHLAGISPVVLHAFAPSPGKFLTDDGRLASASGSSKNE